MVKKVALTILEKLLNQSLLFMNSLKETLRYYTPNQSWVQYSI